MAPEGLHEAVCVRGAAGIIRGTPVAGKRSRRICGERYPLTGQIPDPVVRDDAVYRGAVKCLCALAKGRKGKRRQHRYKCDCGGKSLLNFILDNLLTVFCAGFRMRRCGVEALYSIVQGSYVIYTFPKNVNVCFFLRYAHERGISPFCSNIFYQVISHFRLWVYNLNCINGCFCGRVFARRRTHNKQGGLSLLWYQK